MAKEEVKSLVESQLDPEELNVLNFVVNQVPEMGGILDKLTSYQQEDNVVEGPTGIDKAVVMATPGEYVIPVGVVDALGVDYFDNLVAETKSAIEKNGSGATLPNETPPQQGE